MKMNKLSNLEFFKLVAGNGDAGSAESRFIYPPAIAKTLGFRLIEVGPGTATMEIVVDTDKHANPMGTIHGGVLCDIADAAIGTAHATSLEEARVLPASICKSTSFARYGMAGFARPPNL